MIAIKGQWYDGKTSTQEQAVCQLYGSGEVRVIREKDGQPLLALSRFDVQVSPRLGNTPRYLTFPAGAKFETDDNDGVDALLNRLKRRDWLSLVHKLETHKGYILLCLACLIAVVFLGVKYGVPATAKAIAFRLPTSTLDYASDHTLEVLDKGILDSSELDDVDQERIRKHFQKVVDDHAAFDLRVLFRKGGLIGPNALALPDGRIVFTDEMVAIAAHDDELLAVMAHEIGHILHRHSMRALIQDSLLAFMVLAFTGDVSGTSELFMGMPVLLTELSFSRDFEREADRYALEYLRANRIPTAYFADLMRRVQGAQEENASSSGGRWTGYLSTHPITEERLVPFEQEPGDSEHP